MIGSVTIRVSAGRPNMPVGPVAIIQGSACTIGVIDVPRRRFGVEITRVAVSVCNGVGTTSNVPAKFECGVWTSTFDASLFSQPGSVENGVKVFCGGKDENEVEREWTIGVGDVEILPAGEVPVPAPGESWQNVHLRDEEPETPVKGDLYKFEDGWKIYDGEEWQAIGGGGGGAVSSVNGKTGAVLLTGADIKTSDDDEETLADKVVSLGTDVGAHIQDTENPHEVTAEQVGAYTSEEVDDRLADKQDALSDAQKAVLEGGPYLPATPSEQVEGSFDILAGTLQNISASRGDFGDSLSKGGQEVATEELVNGLSQYPIKPVVGNALLDRTVNTSTGGAFTFPSANVGARDFVVVIAPDYTEPAVSFPLTGFEYFSDDENVWTAAVNAVNVWYFTEIGENQFMVAHKALEQTTQA